MRFGLLLVAIVAFAGVGVMDLTRGDVKVGLALLLLAGANALLLI